MTMQDALKLQVGDTIDYRDKEGLYVQGTVWGKQGTNLKIRNHWDTWTDFSKELHRFAVAGSISKRKAHRFGFMKKGDYVDINPSLTHPGWKEGEFQRLDDKSGQAQLRYTWRGNKYLYWSHLDNEAEIAVYKTKSNTSFDFGTYLDQQAVALTHSNSAVAQRVHPRKPMRSQQGIYCIYLCNLFAFAFAFCTGTGNTALNMQTYNVVSNPSTTNNSQIGMNLLLIRKLNLLLSICARRSRSSIQRECTQSAAEQNCAKARNEAGCGRTE